MEIDENSRFWVEVLLGIVEREDLSSCLLLALRAARFNLECLSEKSVVSRVQECTDEFSSVEISSFSLLSAVTHYMIALDIMGCCFEIKGSGLNEKNSIKRILKQFSSLTNEECNAISDLRNTMAHNFGLATEKNKPYRFHLEAKSPVLVVLPKKKWGDGFTNKYDDNRLGTETTIGVEKLSELVCHIYHAIRTAYNGGRLSLRSGSVNELQTRFLLRIS